MTLGRTAENAIKIKVEEDTTRAVNCACCVPLICGCMVVPNDLKTIIESATQVSVNGISQSWNGSSAAYNGNPPIDFILWTVTYEGGVICAQIDDSGLNTVKFAPEPFTAEECFFDGATITQNGSINGQAFRVAEAFPSYPLLLTVVFS
jgi:hypothetical protein